MRVLLMKMYTINFRTEIYAINFRIAFKYGKMQTRKTPNKDTFCAVIFCSKCLKTLGSAETNGNIGKKSVKEITSV